MRRWGGQAPCWRVKLVKLKKGPQCWSERPCWLNQTLCSQEKLIKELMAETEKKMPHQMQILVTKKRRLLIKSTKIQGVVKVSSLAVWLPQGHSEPLALSSIQLTLTQKKAKFLVLSFFTLSVPYLLFTVVSYPLSISMTYYPCKPPLQTHRYNLVLPSFVSNWFPLATSSIPSPPTVTCLGPLGSQETSPLFFHTTRKGRRGARCMPVLTFPRHDLLARALEESNVVSIF